MSHIDARNTESSHTAALPDDVRLDYLTQGETGGRPVLFLHGYSDSCRSYKPVFEAMPRHIRLFAPSFRGHGDSSRPMQNYRTRDFSADIAAFIRGVHAGPMVVVGHSMGTAVAMRLAADHPELVGGLILIGAFATFNGHADLVEFYRDVISQLQDPVDEGFVREFQESTLANPVAPGVLESAIHESLKLSADVWKQTGRGLFDDDFSDDLHRIRARTRVIWGDRDSMSPRADQVHLVRAIPNATLSIHRGAGHAVHWENPDILVEELIAFLANEPDATRQASTAVIA